MCDHYQKENFKNRYGIGYSMLQADGTLSLTKDF